jgi:glycerol-3-phosphate acyltransferase PlsY
MTLGLLLVAAFTIGYAFGCVPVADLVARRHGLKDLRQVADRNPGYWNARERLGRREAVPILLLDAGKGAAGAAIGLALAGPWGGVVGWAGAIFGHMFPAQQRFRGGRSVLCLAGGAIVMAPLACVVAGVVLVVVRFRFGFARGAQAALIVTPFLVRAFYDAGVTLFATVALLVVIGVRAATADRALKRAGIEKSQPDRA